MTRAAPRQGARAWRRKQTIASGERFTCDDLDALADKLAHAEERAARARPSSSRRSSATSPRTPSASARSPQRLAAWDVAAALAEVAHRDDWARPDVDDSLELVLEDARHPVVEKLAAARPLRPERRLARRGARGGRACGS